jgi:hypothetical protein
MFGIAEMKWISRERPCSVFWRQSWPAAVAVFLALMVPAQAAESAAKEPPASIDVSTMPATVVDAVIVPVPSEVFGVLEKLGSPNWNEVLRTTRPNPMGERAQVALLLGTVIAEGFIAVEAQESEEVKQIGRSVLNLAGAIGVRKSVTARSNAIIEAADKRDWPKVRAELDGALQDVKAAMIELRDEQLAQLVSLGGWLRGTEALTVVVRKNYSKDGAELLHQPALIDFFTKRLADMDPRLRNHELVARIQQRLLEIKPLISAPEGIGSETVTKVHEITAELVKAITARKM